MKKLMLPVWVIVAVFLSRDRLLSGPLYREISQIRLIWTLDGFANIKLTFDNGRVGVVGVEWGRKKGKNTGGTSLIVRNVLSNDVVVEPGSKIEKELIQLTEYALSQDKWSAADKKNLSTFLSLLRDRNGPPPGTRSDRWVFEDPLK